MNCTEIFNGTKACQGVPEQGVCLQDIQCIPGTSCVMNKCVKTIPVGGSCDHVSAECGFGTRCYSGICTAYGSLLIGTYLNLTFDDEAQANANLTQNPYPLSTMYLC